jgi:hypothetical protein
VGIERSAGTRVSPCLRVGVMGGGYEQGWGSGLRTRGCSACGGLADSHDVRFDQRKCSERRCKGGGDFVLLLWNVVSANQLCIILHVSIKQQGVCARIRCTLGYGEGHAAEQQRVRRYPHGNGGGGGGIIRMEANDLFTEHQLLVNSRQSVRERDDW